MVHKIPLIEDSKLVKQKSGQMQTPGHATQSKGWNLEVVGCKILKSGPFPSIGGQRCGASQ